MVLEVAVIGAGGRMGSTVCTAIGADSELSLVAAVDPHHMGAAVPDSDLTMVADIAAVADAGASVLVEFTRLDAARENLAWAAANGVHAVVGTTGFDENDLERFRATFTESNCLIVPNFAIGAVLMMRFAELAAPWFDTAEIVEYHHDQKIDAPSGTAMLTAERMAAASATWGADPTTKHVVANARGGVGPGNIHMHAVRMRGMVAHQEVVLGTEGQTLTIRHDSIDRSSFMPGVVLAVKQVVDHPGVTVGLEPVLGL